MGRYKLPLIAIIFASMLAVLISGATIAPAAETTCDADSTSCDGSGTLSFWQINGDEGKKTAVFTNRSPVACRRAIGCVRGHAGFAGVGEFVAVGKTCGNWSYVQLIGKRSINYGWIESKRLSKWMPEEINGPRSPVSNEEPTNRYKFLLISGRGIPVCEAYQQRLNQTEFIGVPSCGRPENDAVPGFELLHRSYVSAAEENRLSGLSVPSSIKVGSWRYAPPVDSDNDGVPDNVLVWNLDDPKYPSCGTQHGGQTNGLDRGYQIALILNTDWTLDAYRTQEIFGDSSVDYSDVAHEYGFLNAFNGFGHSYSLFRYRGVTYFDTFLRNKRESSRPLASNSSTLGVFLRRNGKTESVCTLKGLF